MRELTRRDAIKAGAAATGMLWAAPAIRTSRALAAPGSPAPGQSIHGQVTDATTGIPIQGAIVTLDGGPTSITDANGNYQFPSVSVGGHSLTADASGYNQASSNVNVPSGADVTENFGLVPAGSGNVSVVLSWGAAPQDLDLHMSGPDPSAPSGRFHVAYYDRNPNDYVSQDVDDIDGNGPETDTVTISTTNGGTFVPGSYHVWVHNYAHTYYPGSAGEAGQNFDGSGGKVVINGLGGQVAQFLVSAASGNPDVDIWHIAEFTLDAAGNLTMGTVFQTLEPGNESTIL